MFKHKTLLTHFRSNLSNIKRFFYRCFPEKGILNKNVVPNNYRGCKLFEKKNKPERGGRLFRNEEYINENSILLFYYIYLLYIYFKFWNLCDLSKRRSLLHLIFWVSIFFPARVVTAIKISL